MVNGFDVEGITELQLLASPTQGVQYYIRDIFVSDGREYDKDNVSVAANKFWNHGCDNYSGVPSQFETTVILYFKIYTYISFIEYVCII